MEIDHLWLALLGAGLVTAVLLDLVWTTITVGAGRGPLSNAVAAAVSSVGRAGRPGHRRLQVTGVVVAAAVPATWVMLAWLGFSIMFLADDDAVVVAASQEPTTALGRVAYAAGGLAGAGASLVAGTETWELVNNVSAIVGLVLVTLSLTYLLQVVTAVASERSTASEVAGLGRSPSEAVAVALRSRELGTLPLQLVSIAGGISQAAQNHLALPVLQFFHSGRPTSAMSLNVARYDEMLSLLEHALPGDHGSTVRAGRQAVDDFVYTLDLPETAAPPPPPPLEPLQAVRDDVADRERFAAELRAVSERRARLHAFVQQESWTWEDVHGSSGTNAAAPADQ